MNITNKALLNLFSGTLTKNKKFRGVEDKKSCYIFGNGSSLKYYDLKKFSDRESIGCNVLFAHQDLKNLNIKYYFVGHPFLFHTFWKNPYSKNYERNRLGEFYRQQMALLPEIQYFTSLTNYFGIRGDNINYLHHFGQAGKARVQHDMHEVFSMMQGSLAGMIGIALYLGYAEITLVGCDYTFSPKMQGHFYEKGPEGRTEGPAFLSETLKLVKDQTRIQTVTPNNEFRGDCLPSVTYKELTGADPIYNSAHQIVSDENLRRLDSVNMRYRIY